MTYKRASDQVINDRRNANMMYSGVESLAFTILECPTSQGRYHAIGVYRVGQRLHVSHVGTDFAIRQPQTARDLYLATYGHDSVARRIHRNWNNLPAEMAALIAEAAQG